MRFLRYSVLLCTALLLTFNSSQLQAAYPTTSGWDNRWQCGKEIPIKKSHIKDLIKHKKLFAYRLKGKALPLLISESHDGSGVIVFTRLNSRWRAYPIASYSIPNGVFSTASHYRIGIFTSGYNQQFTALMIKKQMRDIQCKQLPVHPELDSFQYLMAHSFNVLPSGAGQLISTTYSTTKDGKPMVRWFRSHTNDWGYSWGKPGPIKAQKRGQKPKGAFFPTTEFSAPKWLTSSLLRQARWL